MARVDGGGPGLLVQQQKGDFGGIFFGVVDELAIIPVASGDILALDGDGAGPRGATSCVLRQSQ